MSGRTIAGSPTLKSFGKVIPLCKSKRFVKSPLTETYFAFVLILVFVLLAPEPKTTEQSLANLIIDPINRRFFCLKLLSCLNGINLTDLPVTLDST